MRFGLISKNEQQGNKRVVQKFLWTPLTLDHQTRWLETVKIRQVCNLRQAKVFEGKITTAEPQFFWDDLEWVDDDDGNSKTIRFKLISNEPL